MNQDVESGYYALRETVDKFLNHSGYAIVNLEELFLGLMTKNKFPDLSSAEVSEEFIVNEDEDEDEF